MSISDRWRALVEGVGRALGGSRSDTTDTPTAEAAVALEAEADPAHAAGHQHLGPPPKADAPSGGVPEPPRHQPWVRTTHSDSQKRRPRG